MPVRVVPVPALEDNYMYVLIDEETKQCGVVDPVDASAMITAAEREGATITAILTTHSHWDHAGGNVELKKRCASVEVVYGGAGDGVAGCTKELNDGDTFALGNSTVQVLSTPCHTAGHICYLVDGNVFTGDTMFVSGCGNFNSGTPAQMAQAFQKLLALPDDTKVWVGHEYTCKNCRFALFAEPDNAEIQRRLKWAESCHSWTVPSTIGDEKRCNPFARLGSLPMFENEPGGPAERMRLVRKAKDDWGRR